MTQEEEQLLLIDLCARLPYGVKVRTNKGPVKLEGLAPFCFYEVKIASLLDWSMSASDYTPYLRSMSSMTEEEKEEFHKLKQFSVTVIMPNGVSRIEPTYIVDLEDDGDGLNHLYDWLNAHHFDYRGLIEKGLALEAPEGMYNY